MGVSERFACRVTGQNRTTQRRAPAPTTVDDPDAALCEWLRAWAKDHPRRGFRNAYRDARCEGWQVNHKKIQRLWREEGLRVPTKRRRKRLGTSTTENPPKADAPNKVWAVDFQFDATTDGRPIKIASIVDEHTRECPGGLVERNITGEDLTSELDRIAAERGYPGCAAMRQRTRAGLRRDGRLGRRTRRAVLHPARRALALTCGSVLSMLRGGRTPRTDPLSVRAADRDARRARRYEFDDRHVEDVGEGDECRLGPSRTSS
jgi:hypothetical protein